MNEAVVSRPRGSMPPNTRSDTLPSTGRVGEGCCEPRFMVFHTPSVPNPTPPTVSPRRRPGSIPRSPHTPQGRPVGTEGSSHTSRQRHYPRMDPGLRRGDTECGDASVTKPQTYPHPLRHPPQSIPSPRNCAVATNGRRGDNRGAWVARLVRGCQGPAGRWLEADRDKTSSAPEPDRPTRKGGCLRRAQKIPVRWRDQGFTILNYP